MNNIQTINNTLETLDTYSLPIKLINAMGELPALIYLTLLKGAMLGTFPEVAENTYLVNLDKFKLMINATEFNAKKFKGLEKHGLIRLGISTPAGRHIEILPVGALNDSLKFGHVSSYYIQLDSTWKSIKQLQELDKCNL